METFWYLRFLCKIWIAHKFLQSSLKYIKINISFFSLNCHTLKEYQVLIRKNSVWCMLPLNSDYLKESTEQFQLSYSHWHFKILNHCLLTTHWNVHKTEYPENISKHPSTHKHKESDVVLKTHWKNSSLSIILRNIPVFFFLLFAFLLFSFLCSWGEWKFWSTKRNVVFTLGHLLGNLKFQTTPLNKLIC